MWRGVGGMTSPVLKHIFFSLAPPSLLILTIIKRIRRMASGRIKDLMGRGNDKWLESLDLL
jgi:hypothetical protein